ncbi:MULTISPECIES: carbon-nitrogen hydrolase family protein [unclassified Cryobacterium]|uniref:carbon-nitrogen hydrolase family protein n=1 Tax=unclassified Cryobacterium TaxID=2649013 RepID=UPI002AB3BD1B|nr:MULTISPECIES: carbon-nitrogen hydrolase family protein [unclassified Cryobacterium]MDY7544363.1 carbon-nitrogen hydrolase family protein [Cryobacterium sp. 5B3]MEA9998764.1 carbon-nitrogen hydrolase family protein [Cryobacterium sp. RTS3]MEB0266278.1 carbon-nitrogen hydrolase family protein [Cryobacterium sp. 10I5]MEB0274139.1 carbon-nitrogen hydrolase family protein [Cryobacterium sp. 5B3]
MTRRLTIAAVQVPPQLIGASVELFAAEFRAVLAAAPSIDLVVFPELHLFGSAADRGETAPEPVTGEERNATLRASARPLDGPLSDALGALAREAGVWLVPGSVCELGPEGELFNTALVYAPTGERVASYRKMFPWRPFEPYDPGDRFVVFDMPGVGRLGLSICYDAWFPEVTRHLAWLGAEVVLNLVKTTTDDRAQELVLAQANSIVNQVFTVSVNCAGPAGRGRSIIVDPEGLVLAESAGAHAETLVTTLDLEHVTRVRDHGTAGTNRPWAQFADTDAAIELPLYGGRISPLTWRPRASSPASPDSLTDSAAPLTQ